MRIGTVDLTRESPPPKPTPIIEEKRTTRKTMEQKKIIQERAMTSVIR
jgi:hypothetical protein